MTGITVPQLICGVRHSQRPFVLPKFKGWVWGRAVAKLLKEKTPKDSRERMVTHSSILAWRIPWTEEPGRLQYMALQGVGHDWATNTFTFNLSRLTVWGSERARSRWLNDDGCRLGICKLVPHCLVPCSPHMPQHTWASREPRLAPSSSSTSTR